ncbi:MAG: MFS transporter [Candidatus Dormiibacterota bacterium]
MPKLYRGWTIVVALGAVTIVGYGTSQYLFGVLLPPVTQALGGNRAQLSAAYSAGLVVAAIVGVPIGRLVDRVGARGILAAGGAIAAATLLLLARATSLLELTLLWTFGVGLSMALTQYPVSFVVVANWFERRRPAAMALLTTIGGLSSPICIPLAGWLIATVGWRAALGVLAVLAASTILIAVLFVRRRPEDLGLRPDGAAQPAHQVAPSARGGSTGETARNAVRRPAFWLLTAGGVATMFAANALQVHQVSFLITRGEAPLAAASIAGTIGLVSVPGRFLLNLAGQRVSPQRLLAAAMATMAVAVSVLVVLGGTGAALAYAVLYGVGYGAVTPLRGTVMALHFGRRSYGAITALQNLAVVGGSAAGPLAIGQLYDLQRTYRPAFVLLAAVLGFGVVATALAPMPAQVTRGTRTRT